MKENKCSFIPETNEISDERKRNTFLNFGDISVFNPPSKVQGNLFTHDFSNPLDIAIINQATKDEGFEEVSFSSKFEFLHPSNSIPSTQRNPYKLSERLFSSSSSEVNINSLEGTLISCTTKRSTLNSHQECERNPSKVQYGIANLEEAGNLEQHKKII